jgi:hypothetical protein
VQTKTVALSDGSEVKVGPLSWRAAKQIKRAIIDVLANDAERLLPLIDQVRSGDLPGAEAIKVLGTFVVGALDDLSEQFVNGCCGGHLDFANLSYSEALALSTAASELNDVEQLVLAEGNAVAGRLVKSLVARLAPKTGTASNGVSSSTLDLFDGASQPGI